MVRNCTWIWMLLLITCWTCVHLPASTGLPVDDGIEPYVTSMGEELLDDQDIPKALNLNFNVRTERVSLNLTRNPNVPCKVPIYIGKEGKIRKIESCATEDFAVYTDERNIASILLRPKRMEDGRMKREFSGHFRMGTNEYTLKPAPESDERRRKREARGRTSSDSSYIITREPIEDELLNFDSDSVERPSLMASTRFAQELVDFYQPDPVTGARIYEVETLWVLDYGMYDKWFRRSTARTTSGREAEAIDGIRYYFSHVANGVDLRYRSIREPDYAYRIKLSAFYIAATPGMARFSETNREGSRPIYVEAYDMLDDVEAWLEDVRDELPNFDQATVFTGYRLFSRRSDGSRRTIHGLADIRGVCTKFGASVNNDGGQYASTQTAAHEMGHSLGAIHDGIYNGCESRDQYIMAVSPGNLDTRNFNNTFKFSHCSRHEFRQHLTFMNMQGTNCLTNEAKTNLDAEIDRHLSRPPGQIFSPDDQCRYIKGPESYYCAGQPNDDKLCEMISCYEPDERKCVTRVEHRAANGTTCGDKKWCMFGRCVEDSRAPPAQDRCLSGDYRAVLYDRSRCEDIVLEPWKCYREDFGGPCCASCENLRVADKPDCKYGDKGGWCRTISSSDCYTRTTSESCCETCAAAKVDIKDCTYGDRASWCNNIKVSSCYFNSRSCCATCAKTRERTAGKYPTGCDFGDRASWCTDVRTRPWMCYVSGDTCCASCETFLTGLPGCKYGNRIYDCGNANCKDPYYQNKCCSTCARALGLTTRRPTRRPTTTTTTTTTTRPTTTTTTQPTTTTTTTRQPSTSTRTPLSGQQNCIMQAVDLASWCSKADFFPGNCYDSDHICCVTCATLAINRAVCKYGDKNQWCPTVFPGFCYSQRTRHECCKTCADFLDESRPDCEYGDRFSWCQREGVDRCTEPDFRQKCCSMCRGYGPPTPAPPETTTAQTTTTSTTTVATTTTDGDTQPQDCSGGDLASWCPTIPTSYCYTQNNICCKTCKRYYQVDKPGCEYGDRFTWCPTLSKNRCVEESIRTDCCQFCSDFVFSPVLAPDPSQANNPVCTTGDKVSWCPTIEPPNCYLARDRNLCCDSCAKFYTANKGCEFGDRYAGCLEDFRPWECYVNKVYFDCCYTCSTKHYIGEPDCEFGDKVANCDTLDCSDPFVRKKCCKTCQNYQPNNPLARTPANDPLEKECTGDHAEWCSTIEYHHCYGSDQVCCDTCNKMYIGFKGCEYGDRVGWCKRQVKDRSDCDRDDIGKSCCKTCTLIGNPSTRESPEEWKEGVIVSFLNKNMSRAIKEESDMLIFLSHQVNEFCMENPARCCAMLYRTTHNINNTLSPSNITGTSDLMVPSDDEKGEGEGSPQRRRPTIRLVTPRDTQVAGGYPRYSDTNDGEIITKYIVRVPVPVLEQLCHVPPVVPVHRVRREAGANGGRARKEVVYFDKYILHQMVIDNRNIIESALGVRISAVDVAGVRSRSRVSTVIGLAVGVVSAVVILLALVGLMAWRLHRVIKRRENSEKNVDKPEFEDGYRPKPTSRQNKVEHWGKAAGTISSLNESVHSLGGDTYLANQRLPGISYMASENGQLTVLPPGAAPAAPASPPPPYRPGKVRAHGERAVPYAWVETTTAADGGSPDPSSDDDCHAYVDAMT